MISTPIEHPFTIQRSPIVLAPLIHQFYASSQLREKDLLLSYLILPMVLYPSMQKYLLNVRKTSDLRTMCSEQSRLVGLTHNVQQSKPLTHAAMLVLKAEQAIEIANELSVRSVRDVKIDNANPKQLEAAHRLSMVFADTDIVSIYRTLGFKSL
ncbi:MAG: hypothetical protein XXXJIFNMEKO3_02086 [Candidatus Erwinia impunctatus]|nr:hypothetical protein XXXJIFNMEKO_02086 [Culicoides impunctatus]